MNQREALAVQMFGAGLTQGDAIAAAMRMLGTDPDVRDVHLPDDVPPNAGSAT